MNNERRLKLEQTLKELNKTAKEKLFDYADNAPDSEVLPFGIPELDKFYGGGVPRRKYTVDFGGEDTGKSTRALHLVANTQNNGGICMYIDLERKFDKERAEQLGVNLSELVLIQRIQTAEESMDSIRKVAQDKVVDLVVLDSIHSLSPKSERETKKGKQKSIEDDEIALLARKLGKFFRVTSADVFRANMAVYLIGQVRQNIGGFFAFATLSGGNALRHFMSICTFSRKGQKSDFPVEKYKEEYTDPEGKIRKRTVSKVVGFDCVLKMFKSHINGSAREGNDIHLPFYFSTGFHEPLDIKKEPKLLDEEIKKQPESKIINMVKDEIKSLEEGGIDVSESKKELEKLDKKDISIKDANPHASDKKQLKKAVETSTAIKGRKADCIINDDVMPEDATVVTENPKSKTDTIIDKSTGKIYQEEDFKVALTEEKPKKRGRKKGSKNKKKVK